MGKNVRIEGILKNYTIKGPDKIKLLFERCRFLAQKPKKKKQKKDFGTDFIWNLPDEVIDSAELNKRIKKAKIKLDADLIEGLANAFSKKKKKVELNAMRTAYLEMYPDTIEPPPPKKKGKKGKKGAEAKELRPSTVEKAIGTDTSIMMIKSSLVTPKMDTESGLQLMRSLSKAIEQPEEPVGPEEVVSTINLDLEDKEVPAQEIAPEGSRPSIREGAARPSQNSSQIKAKSVEEGIQKRNKQSKVAFHE